jgi:hypothetical protein
MLHAALIDLVAQMIGMQRYMPHDIEAVDG